MWTLRAVVPVIFTFSLAFSAGAAESDALAISANIQARHMPFGTILDPINASPTSNQIIGYTRCGDSALWTGGYLAAESFRYSATHSASALNNVQTALAGLKSLVDVTGNDLLARCIVSANSSFAQGIESEEASNGIYQSPPNIWVGKTSRDEYIGVMFGLAVAYDYAGNAVQTDVSALVTRLVAFLMNHGWTIVMPDGTSTDTFLIRPEELLMLLQVAAHVNPAQFAPAYSNQRSTLSPTLVIPASVDISNNSSYFKFNLDYMSFYNLMRLENMNSAYAAAYAIVRGYTASHQNAFFDIIDRAIAGPNSARDAEFSGLLQQWLSRPARDTYVDLSKSVPVCGSEACQPVPVPQRPPTDFLWQRDPFQLTGGGSGVIESAGIDYILPYWMGRALGVLSAPTVQSAAAASAMVAPDSIASMYGSNLANTTAQASLPLTTNLGGITLNVTDAAGQTRAAPLIYVSPGQINFVVPSGTAAGAGSVTVGGRLGAGPTATATVQNVAPTLFSADGTGTGVAAASAIQVQAANPQLQGPVTVYQCTASGCASVPIRLGVDTPIYLSLYGTGIRNRSSLSNVQVTINGIAVPVLYAGPQPDFPGLDQVNVALTLQLRGAGESNVVLTVDGQPANTVTVNVQ
ncbi:MAG: hypothetical protein JO307_27795 [Bryobacterales bacterium]|nr:hypothetical protein [Bryobacterales bacterium]MBV9400912.1 hypothetical protein [Bryobacterales bacterium]